MNGVVNRTADGYCLGRTLCVILRFKSCRKNQEFPFKSRRNDVVFAVNCRCGQILSSFLRGNTMRLCPILGNMNKGCSEVG